MAQVKVRKKPHRKRNVRIIFPSLITSISMVCGFLAIIYACDDRVVLGCYLVLIASFMDGIDGKVARLTNSASDFGIQYDSLADLVAFGIAPSVIYFRHYLYEQNLDRIFVLLPIMFLLCGAIRLARFNITASIFGKAYFTGLPIPAAAVTFCIIPPLEHWLLEHPGWVPEAWTALMAPDQSFNFSVGLMVVLSLSMISNMKFDTFETFWFKKYRPKQLNWVVFGVIHSLLFIHFIVYMTGVAIYYIVMMYGRELIFRFNQNRPVRKPIESEESSNNE